MQNVLPLIDGFSDFVAYSNTITRDKYAMDLMLDQYQLALNLSSENNLACCYYSLGHLLLILEELFFLVGNLL